MNQAQKLDPEEEKLRELNIRTLLIMDRPVVGLTSPEFQIFARLVRQAIYRKMKSIVYCIKTQAIRFFRYAIKKANEGAEIHNRMIQTADERYAKNEYHIRRGL